MSDIKMVALKALGGFKAKTLDGYVTRRLRAGDSFLASPQLAGLLDKLGRAKAIRDPGKVPAPPRRVVERAAERTPPLIEAKLPPDTVVGAMTTVSTPTGRKTTRRGPRTKK